MAMALTLKGTPQGGLHPQVQAVLDAVSADTVEGAAIPLDALDPVALRSAPDALAPFGLPPEKVGGVESISADKTSDSAINLRIYMPPGEGPYPVVVFFHGGCWVFCSLDTHDSICRYLCTKGACVVVSVDYRLAPEAPFPAAINDGLTALEWVQQHISEYRGNAARLAVAGDSAGANIAAVLSQKCRDQREAAVDICCQVLMYPITEIASKCFPSHSAYATGYFFEADFFEWACQQYTQCETRADPGVSPLLAEDLSGLPPAMILTAEYDILRDEGEAYAEKLARAGVSVEAVRYLGMVHAFIAMAGSVEMGKDALDDCITFLQRAWSNDS